MIRKKRVKNMRKRSDVWGIINIYNIIIVILGIGFYFLLPILLNYAPGSYNSYFETQIDSGMNYCVQFFLAILAVIIIVDTFVWFQFKEIKSLEEITSDDNTRDKECKIKAKCFRLPFRLYLYEITIIPVIVAIVLWVTKTEIGLIIKTTLIIFLFATVLSISAYVFTRNKMKQLFNRINNFEICGGKSNISLASKIFLQIFPLFLVISIFLSFLGYVRLINEKGLMRFEEYTVRLNESLNHSIATEKELFESANKIVRINPNDEMFIIRNNEVLYNEGSELSGFFIKYATILGEEYNGHLYDYYGSDIQGTAKYIMIENNNYIVGVKYNLVSQEMILVFVCGTIFMLLLTIFVLVFLSKDLSDDIGEVGMYLYKLSNQDSIDYDKKLPVTSNDEIGELVISFNKILDLEKNNIETMSRNQEILVEQERLSSLGQLIGGIAHNLKTPIMSISGALEGVEDLIKEYDESIDDSQVTKEDHHQIAGEMKEWISKIRPYLSYMTEVIDAVKGQAVSMNASTVGEFSAEELIARTQILMKNELKRRHCNLNLDLNISEKTQIKGEISAIVQVMDNLIINAMDAYGEKGGNIDIKVREDEDKVYIEVADLAGGISSSVKDKLFKEMITSKGKNGTGLGLYMCYSTIKGKFDGDMWFESKEGVGTTFHITLNKLKIS